MKKNAAGRRLRNQKIAMKTLLRTAVLVDEALNSEPGCADYKVALREAYLRVKLDRVKQIFGQIKEWGLPPDLIVVAACRELRIGRRTRRRPSPIWTQEVTAQRLRKKGFSENEATAYALEYFQGDEEVQIMVDALLEDNFPYDNQDQRQCCVSKTFPTTIKNRQMPYYWRKHPKYERAKTLILELVETTLRQELAHATPREN